MLLVLILTILLEELLTLVTVHAFKLAHHVLYTFTSPLFFNLGPHLHDSILKKYLLLVYLHLFFKFLDLRALLCVKNVIKCRWVTLIKHLILDLDDLLSEVFPSLGNGFHLLSGNLVTYDRVGADEISVRFIIDDKCSVVDDGSLN